jgi:hypothetical protein
VKDGIVQEIRQTNISPDQIPLPGAGVDIEGGA